MSKMNWGRENDRARMRRWGTESVRGDDAPFAAPLIRPNAPRRRQIPKAQLRAETSTAVAQYRGPITKAPAPLDIVCPGCGHRATIAVHMRPGLTFRCKECDAKFHS